MVKYCDEYIETNDAVHYRMEVDLNQHMGAIKVRVDLLFLDVITHPEFLQGPPGQRPYEQLSCVKFRISDPLTFNCQFLPTNFDRNNF
jgi:hypothetical protein